MLSHLSHYLLVTIYKSLFAEKTLKDQHAPGLACGKLP